MKSAAPVVCPLELLLVLDAIDADPAGEKLRRKLETVGAYASLLRNEAIEEALRGLPERTKTTS